jgi:hypothetical protein
MLTLAEATRRLSFDSMDNDYNNLFYRAENDVQQDVIAVTEDFIICIWSCAVLDSEIRLYDHNYNLIAKQTLYPNRLPFDKWSSYVFGEDER